jgi:preprotein translocase subunit YajC
MIATVLILAKAATKSSGSTEDLLLIYVVIFAALYFFFLRPRRRKQAAQRQVQRKVEVGDRAQTIGGFVATVVKVDDEFVTLRTDSGAELDFIPSAIARKYESIVHESADDEPDAQEGDKT